MTLTYKLDLDILKMYLHIEMEFSGQGFQKLRAANRTDTHRDRRNQTHYRPHSWIIGNKHKLTVIKKCMSSKDHQQAGVYVGGDGVLGCNNTPSAELRSSIVFRAM